MCSIADQLAGGKLVALNVGPDGLVYLVVGVISVFDEWPKKIPQAHLSNGQVRIHGEVAPKF